MHTKAGHILEEAMQLSETERAYLAELLFASLDTEPAIALDDSWEEELRRRIDGVNSGSTQLFPWDEARKRIFGNE